jgi:hypothetical protein
MEIQELKKIVLMRFTEFVKMEVTTTRRYYNDQAGNSNVAFICVSHDGWDPSKMTNLE